MIQAIVVLPRLPLQHGPSMYLKNTLAAWNTPEFEAIAKQEILGLNPDLLPLQQGLSHSNTANADSLSVRIISTAEQPEKLQIKAGLFYTGIIAGCSCSDDPTPNDEMNEYCEVRIDIDRQTGEATVTLVPD